jgi:hypothetical protein
MGGFYRGAYASPLNRPQPADAFGPDGDAIIRRAMVDPAFAASLGTSENWGGGNPRTVSSSDAYSPTLSRTGGALPPSAGASANVSGAYSPSPPSSAQPAALVSGTDALSKPEASASGGNHLAFSPNGPSLGQPAAQPNLIRDVYAPQLQEVGQKLESAYAAPRPGMFRQVTGALLSRRNPQLGGLVSGETQRQQAIEPLQQEYGLVSGQIGAQRAADLAALNAQNIQSEIAGRTDLAKYHEGILDVRNNPAARQTPDEQAIDNLQGQVNPDTGKPYTRYEATIKYKQDVQDTKPGGAVHTSPFEAFAYGTPQEKQSAQDFLALEKKVGAKYQKPDEVQSRYALFQKDPDAYRAMFGDRGQAAADRAGNAASGRAVQMLSYFQKQRDEISKNFMLGDDEKAQKLQELDQLQKPFMDTASGAGNAGGVGGAGNAGSDRVNVIHPNGMPGTIPRSQLPAAKRKGYRVAQ